MEQKYLSILICTVPPRKKYLNRTLFTLQEQLTKNPQWSDNVEIIIYNDNFESSVGEKRTRLTQEATGLFSCFIDDDDMIMDNYISRLCSIIKTYYIDKDEADKIDHIGFVLMYMEPNKPPIPSFHSIAFNGWFNNKILYTIPEFAVKPWYNTSEVPCRYTTHLNPIRTEISKKYPFPNKGCGEDMERSLKIMEDKALKKEVIIDDVMYIYVFDATKTLTQVADRESSIKNQGLDWSEKIITIPCIRYIEKLI